jgi:ferredoxin
MQELRNIVKELLSKGTVQVVIGYGEGTAGKVRPVFITDPGNADSLIFDLRCKQNLAVYLLKPEVKQLGKAAVVAPLFTLKTILQFAAEFQLAEGDIVIIGMDDEGKPMEFPDLAAVEAFVTRFDDLSPEAKAELDRIEKMPLEERWQYWQKELSRCIKCYACRAACPLCYCTRCTVEINQPQWIPVPSHDLGNLEWHIMRAMHLAGRCVNCGECARACPLDIPLNLLTQKLIREISLHFNQRAGIGSKAENTLSTFKPDDKENFIS